METSTGGKGKANLCNVTDIFETVFLYPPTNLRLNSLPNCPVQLECQPYFRVETGIGMTVMSSSVTICRFINSIL